MNWNENSFWNYSQYITSNELCVSFVYLFIAPTTQRLCEVTKCEGVLAHWIGGIAKYPRDIIAWHFIAMVIYLFCCWFKFIISIKIQMAFFVFKTVHSRRNTSFPKTNQTNQGNEHSKKTPLILIQKWWIYHYHRNNFHIVNLDTNRKLWKTLCAYISFVLQLLA